MAVSLTARKYVRIEIDFKTFMSLLSKNRFKINTAVNLSDGGGISIALQYGQYGSAYPGCNRHYVTYQFYVNESQLPYTYQDSPYPHPHLRYYFGSFGTHAEFYVLRQRFNFWHSQYSNHDSVEAGNLIWKSLGTPTGLDYNFDNDPKLSDWVWGYWPIKVVPTNTNYRVYNLEVNPSGLDELIGDTLHILFGAFRPYILIAEVRIEQALSKTSRCPCKTIYENVLGEPLGPYDVDTINNDPGTIQAIYNALWDEGSCASAHPKKSPPDTLQDMCPDISTVHITYTDRNIVEATQTYAPILCVFAEFADLYLEDGDVIQIQEWNTSIEGDNVLDNIVTESIFENLTNYPDPILLNGEEVQDENWYSIDLLIKSIVCESGALLLYEELTALDTVWTYQADKYLFYRKWLGITTIFPSKDIAFENIPPGVGYIPPVRSYTSGTEVLLRWTYLPVNDPSDIYPSDKYLGLASDMGELTLYSRAFHSKYCNPSFDSPAYDIIQPAGWIKYIFLDEHHPFFDFSVETWVALKDQTGQSFIFL